MAAASVVVRLADLPAVQRLVVAAAGVFDGQDIERLRACTEGLTLVGRVALVELYDALAALEAQS